MINSMKIKRAIKTPVFCFFLIFTIIAIVFVMHEITIVKLNDKISELTVSYNNVVDYSNKVYYEHLNNVNALESKITDLKSENEMQNLTLEEQSELLLDYKQHVADLENELAAYEIALEDAAPMFELPTTWEGSVLTKEIGGNMGPSGRETYYNLPMHNCINKMRELGYDEEEYPYWIREDGAKMLGRYVMVAANWKIRPLGTVIETSLGWAIVVDTGEFVADYPNGVDIAVDW